MPCTNCGKSTANGGFLLGPFVTACANPECFMALAGGTLKASPQVIAKRVATGVARGVRLRLWTLLAGEPFSLTLVSRKPFLNDPANS